jgi:DNA-binding response OmpR family regulator
MSVNRDTLPFDPSAQSHTILLVEDEKGVRDLIRSMLIQHGYRVLSAGDCEVALKIARSHPASIDLLIADIVMPGLNGPELARRLRALRPNLKVLFMSGFVRQAAVQSETLSDARFLEKPFPPEALVGKIHEILHKGSA